MDGDRQEQDRTWIVSWLAWCLAAPGIPYTEGFEDPGVMKAAGWPTAAVDGLVTDEPHEGEHCLRVDSPEGRQRLISLFIPVDAGKSYRGEVWVRCVGVTRNPALQFNRGAAIFGQFAGAKREWIGGGSFPTGLTGDQPWTRIAFD